MAAGDEIVAADNDGAGGTQQVRNDSSIEETAPLLDQRVRQRDDNEEEQDKPSSGTGSLANELVRIGKNSLPVVLAYSLQNSQQAISVLIVGRRSPEDLATASFAYMWAMSTAWLIALGGTTALDTLGSASHTAAAGDVHDLGVLLQRTFVVLTSLYAPIMVLWAFAEPVFLALGQNAQIARDSARFLWCLAPGGLGYVYFECMKKFVQAQGLMRAGTYVLLISAPTNALLNYLFVYTWDFGLLGAPIATGIAYWLSFILLVLYTVFINGSQPWGGWSRRSLHNLWIFYRLALLGILHVGTEWWAFEIIALVAGQLGTISLAAQSVIMSADQVLNTIPFGIGIATSARVGNLLGARDARAASRAAHAAALLSLGAGAIVMAVLWLSRDHFAKLFNDDPRVVQLTAAVLPAVALFQIADGLNGSCGGSLRGMGRQHVGAAVNVLSYYCLALPLGIYLAWNGWGLQGLWWGNCGALYLVGSLEWALVAWTDWQAEVGRALRRLDQREREDVV